MWLEGWGVLHSCIYLFLRRKYSVAVMCFTASQICGREHSDSVSPSAKWASQQGSLMSKCLHTQQFPSSCRTTCSLLLHSRAQPTASLLGGAGCRDSCENRHSLCSSEPVTDANKPKPHGHGLDGDQGRARSSENMQTGPLPNPGAGLPQEVPPKPSGRQTEACPLLHPRAWCREYRGGQAIIVFTNGTRVSRRKRKYTGQMHQQRRTPERRRQPWRILGQSGRRGTGRPGRHPHPSWALGRPTPATAGSVWRSPEKGVAAKAGWAQARGGCLCGGG